MTSTAMAAGTWEDGEAAEKAGNYAEAVKHWRVCADDGNMYCQYWLGYAYASGQGVTEDEYEGNKWWRLSARQGYDGAMIQMSNRYEYGSTVPKDLVSAYMWAELATNISPMWQFRLDNITAKMTQGQIAEGQALARHWAAKWLVK
jgi:hypothetical protein